MTQPKNLSAKHPTQRTGHNPSAHNRPLGSLTGSNQYITAAVAFPPESMSDVIAEESRRKRLLLLLVFLLLAMMAVCGLFTRYLLKPTPLPELLPAAVQPDYPPHYVFSIYGVDTPFGVAVSPGGDRIYVSEEGGERLVKIFDGSGNQIGSFAPPGTTASERKPAYLATDANGDVYIPDLLQHAVFITNRDGSYQDSLIDPELLLSEYVALHLGELLPGSLITYTVQQADVLVRLPGQDSISIPGPGVSDWLPLGVRLDGDQSLLVANISDNRQAVYNIALNPGSPPQVIGDSGSGNGQLSYPQVALKSLDGRTFVIDGNNSRIAVWGAQGNFLFNFGQGTGEEALNLPRGAAFDSQNRLHVVDAVGQVVKVFDISKPEISLLFSFGEMGEGDGEFYYPVDIAIDQSGRLYITDRENNRIQVWSF